MRARLQTAVDVS